MERHRSSPSYGEKLVSGQPQARYPEGRVCIADPCLTLLSRYNPAPTCGRHRGWGLEATPTRRTDTAETATRIDWIDQVLGRCQDAE
jgi:hypothetical protein